MQRNDGGSTGDSGQHRGSFSVGRRSYLKLAGIAAGTAGLGSGSAAAAFERRGIRFKRRVNMVEEAGCDPTGQDPCDAEIRNAAADYTLLVFPEGEYRITEKNYIGEVTNLGFLGKGEVRFRVPERFNEKALVVDRGTGLLFEGIDIDQRADGATPGLHLGADDDLEIHDVEYIGQGIHPDSDPRGEGDGNPEVTNAFTPIVRSESGTGTVTNVVAKNDGLMGAYNAGSGRIGVWIGISHTGTIRLRNCQFEGFPNNGLYCSRTGGAVQAENGVFRNNDITQVRLGSRDSYVKNAIISADFDNSDSPNPGDTLNSRGVRFEAGGFDFGGATVRNCDIAIISTPHSSGGVVVGSDGADHGVYDSRISVEEDNIRGIYAKAPTGFGSRDPPPEPHTATVDNTSITGGASGVEAIRIDERDDSSVSNCCIQQTGSDRDGVRLVDSPSNSVTESTVNVSGEQVVPIDCSPTTNALTADGSCPMATYGAGDYLPHKLTFESNGGRFSYTLAVSGDLGKSTARGASINDNDSISAGMATGQGGGGGADSYGFSGDVLALELTGDAKLYLDGNRIDPSRYPVPHTLTVDGNGDRADYTFSVPTGIVEDSGLGGPDYIDGTTASGAVSSGQDSYRFWGIVTDFTLNGTAGVYINGNRVDPTQLGPRTLTIEGVDTYTEYAFSVDGSIARNDGLTGEDDIAGSTATGAVGGGRDSYRFSGEITEFSMSSDARVSLDGEEVNVTRFLPRTLAIEGTGSRSDYSFDVSGGIAGRYGHSGEDGIDIQRGRVDGAVGGGTDSYAFSGSVTDFDMDGDAIVYLDGEVAEYGPYLSNTVTIASDSSTGARATYSFTVGGGLEKGPKADPNDDLSGRSASGQVGGGGRDNYRFSGDFERFTLDGNARIEVDRSAQEITVVGKGQRTAYRLSVTGRFRRTDSITSEDDTSGGTATGAIRGGHDTYRYTGDVQELRLRNHSAVTVSR